jgi:hypothetical protein
MPTIPTPEYLHALIEQRQKQIADLPTHGAVNMEATKFQADILVAGSQLADLASRRLERQTGWLIKLTWAIVVLTIGLLAFTVYLYKDTHALIQREEAAKSHEAKKP